ncbi:prepilin peptidase [Acetobacter sp. TBRC 12305]|uniref:Prepilin leader peptidase/N-methyltransferase n=1 Tax=Acetobacter garciniae TaxID=2817435 RepID=A0A939KQB6_9PROT|nr:A24 family peptidase [Acetobacter garciniae]MBO1325122.1 prepilin peptidase [Acetobacter garciniae]MBX0344907.1 prepilin peptidase [Acetobacter garciniae]
MLNTPWLVLLLAPFVGSFLGVLACRLPRGERVLIARSACAGCGAVLGPHELVPLVSYLIQNGRCRSCGARIDAEHPAMELMALGIAVLALLACWQGVKTGVYGASFPMQVVWQGCVLGWWLLVLAMIDFRTYRLPDVLTLPLVALGLALAAGGGWRAVMVRGVGAGLGYAAFAGMAALYRRVRGQDGLGLGDAKLLAAAGAWLGPAVLPRLVCAAAVLTLGGAWLATRGGLARGQRVPFGPGLAVAIWGAWLCRAAGLPGP